MKLFYMQVGVAESAFPVEIEPSAAIDDLKNAIKATTGLALPARPLKLFLARRGDDWLVEESAEADALEQGDAEPVRDLEIRPLSPAKRIGEVFAGAPQEDALHVLVADPEALARLLASVPHAAIVRHPIRRKRWRGLNDRLDACKRARCDGDAASAGYSHLKWGDIEDVLEYSTYNQKPKEVPAERMNFLFEYLMLVTKTLGECDHAKREAKLHHFIAPVLVCVCELLGGDTKILVDETVNGNQVHAKSFFEFVIQRGHARFCLVVAKKDDFDQGATQALIGCEVVAEREGLKTVYGVVTDFVRWQFYRVGETKIEKDSLACRVDDGVPEFALVKAACELLYGFLVQEPDDTERKDAENAGKSSVRQCRVRHTRGDHVAGTDCAKAACQ